MNKLNSELKEKTENIIKLIPIIYPLIILLGYYNYFSYYRYFDIDIFAYLSINEVLFSFISLITPVFITVFVIFCYFIFGLILSDTSKNDKKEESIEDSDYNFLLTDVEKRFRRIQSIKKPNISLIFNESHQDLKRYFILFCYKFKSKDYKRSALHFSRFIMEFLSFLIKICIWVFALAFFLAAFELLLLPLDNNLEYFHPFFTFLPIIIITFLILWLIIIYAIIYKVNKNLKKEVGRGIEIGLFIFTLLFSITLFQKIKAEETISRKTFDISFNYENRRIESNSDIIYLGKTSNFIFLRNKNNETNLIYPIEDISQLEIRKLKN